MIRYRSAYYRLTVAVILGFLLASCAPAPVPPTVSPIPITPTATVSASPQPTETLPPPTETPLPERTLSPVDAAYQIVQNSSFDEGTSHWSQRMGKLSHATSQYYTAPGAGLVITNGEGNLGVTGQCAELDERLPEWPATDGEKQITFEAYLKSDENIDEVSLLIIFHQGQCNQDEQFHVQVGTLHSASLSGGEDWTLLSTSGVILEDAIAVDVIIWALGLNDSARVYVDDVRTYPSRR